MKFWEIARKDLRLLLRDRRALATLVVLPLIFITLIGLTTGKLLGWSDTNKVLRIAVVDEIAYDQIGTIDFFADESDADDDAEFEPEQLDEQQKQHEQKIARNIFTKIYNGIQSRNGMEVTKVENREAARAMLTQSQAHTALFIGKDFYKKINRLGLRDLAPGGSGRLAEGFSSLDMHIESKQPDSTTHSIIEEIVWGQTLKTMSGKVLCGNNVVRRQVQSVCQKLDKEADSPPLALAPPQPVTKTSSEVYQDLIPAYTVMFVFFLVNIMARSFIHERELGTLRRLRLAPIKPTSLLAGKTVPFLIISLAQTVLLFVCGKLLFGMSWGSSPWLLLPVIFCTSVAATSLGLLVATVVRTESQVSAIANLVVITMAGISGCFMPRKWLPDLLKQISKATPHAWSLMAYDQLLATPVPDVTLVVECCVWLIAFGGLFFLTGSLRFAHTD